MWKGVKGREKKTPIASGFDGSSVSDLMELA
jgi:hypothetical protein